MSADVMAKWAQFYAARGWPVFPLHVPLTFGPKDGPDAATCSCGRDDCTSQGKHPRTTNGVKEATTDPATVAAWWERWPESNIGLATGVAFDVLDFDSLLAVDTFDAACPDDAVPFPGPSVSTGMGVHYYLEATGQGNRSSLVAKGSGLDWRGVGGYVVAPPSLHYLGGLYSWIDGYGPDLELPAVPGYLAHLVRTRRPCPGTIAARALERAEHLDAARPTARIAVEHRLGTTPYGAAAVEGVAGQLAAAIQGERNDTLNACAFRLGQLVSGGEVDYHEAVAALVAGAERVGLNCSGDKSEGWLTIESGMTGGAADPRTAPASRGLVMAR